MIPEEYKAFYAKKIVLEKDSCVGTGAVLLPEHIYVRELWLVQILL